MTVENAVHEVELWLAEDNARGKELFDVVDSANEDARRDADAVVTRGGAGAAGAGAAAGADRE
jgi:hypothetical protein